MIYILHNKIHNTFRHAREAGACRVDEARVVSSRLEDESRGSYEVNYQSILYEGCMVGPHRVWGFLYSASETSFE